MQVTCGRSSFTLVGLARDDFPKLPSAPKPLAQLDTGLLADCVEKTSFAISQEESRYIINGALLKLKPDGVTMVATDGHRLALANGKAVIPGLKEEISSLIPRKALALLPRLVEEDRGSAAVEIAKDKSHLFFSTASRVIASRLLTGEFPNYESVLPKENGNGVELNRDGFQAVIRRVALLADDRLHGVRLALGKNSMEVSASTPEYGEAKEVIELAGSHEALEIGFNAEYLLEFLAVARGTSSIHMYVKDAESAAEFQPSGKDPAEYRYVLMPIRL